MYYTDRLKEINHFGVKQKGLLEDLIQVLKVKSVDFFRINSKPEDTCKNPPPTAPLTSVSSLPSAAVPHQRRSSPSQSSQDPTPRRRLRSTIIVPLSLQTQPSRSSMAKSPNKPRFSRGCPCRHASRTSVPPSGSSLAISNWTVATLQRILRKHGIQFKRNASKKALFSLYLTAVYTKETSAPQLPPAPSDDITRAAATHPNMRTLASSTQPPSLNSLLPSLRPQAHAPPPPPSLLNLISALPSVSTSGVQHGSSSASLVPSAPVSFLSAPSAVSTAQRPASKWPPAQPAGGPYPPPPPGIQDDSAASSVLHAAFAPASIPPQQSSASISQATELQAPDPSNPSYHNLLSALLPSSSSPFPSVQHSIHHPMLSALDSNLPFTKDFPLRTAIPLPAPPNTLKFSPPPIPFSPWQQIL
ncbi:uncharacterized protein [Lepisosteus oculatus]|uniref:uncharacterized protein n=1 Tax=Lepisosteus oculatus TaxID=7918 RepID=UPI0035F52E99